MKILYLVNIPSPYRVKFFNELGKYCDLTVLFERKIATDREWEVSKAWNFRGIFLNGIRCNSDSSLCLGVFKYLRKYKQYDLIVIGGYGTPTGMLSIVYLKLRKIPFILNCDGGGETPGSLMKKWIKKCLISSASYYLSPAKITDEFLTKYGADQNKIFRYPFTSIYKKNILDVALTREEKLRMRKELGWNSKFIIVTVGRMIPLKGYDIIARACQNLEEVEIYIVGGKPDTVLRKKLLGGNVNNIHFIEFQEHDILNKYYQAADAFVFATRGDVWGLVVNEAMANGLPIISSNKAVASLELVTDNGFLYDVENYNELKKIILYCINNISECEQMGKKSLENIKNYTIENMAITHRDIFNSILLGNDKL